VIMMTVEEISARVGIAPQNVRKRSFLDNYLLSKQSFGGRPRKFYRDEVLAEFGIDIKTAVTKIAASALPATEEKQLMRKRAENTSRGKSRLITEELESRIKSLALQYYLEQARRENKEICVEWACRDLWRQIEKELKGSKSLEQFAWYFYNKRVMRRSGSFVGYAHSEQWDMLWMEKHSKNKFNSSLPTNRWDNVALFRDAGLIGEGFGAGLLWVIDGTQFDAWLDENGKARSMNYLMIMDGITSMPLYSVFLDEGEKIEEVARALWQAVKIHGKPRYGIVLDNGSAFRSKEIQNLIRSWYSPSELEILSGDDFRKRLFDGQFEPFIYPLAGIPRYPFKAVLERIFEELSRFMSEELPLSFIGTRDSRAVSHELGSTPSRGVAARVTREKAFERFLVWIYTDFIYRKQPKFDWLKRAGIENNLLNVWQYLGGKYFANQRLCLPEDVENVIVPSDVNKFLPELSWYYAEYAMGERHKVKAYPGRFILTENKIQYNFTTTALDLSLVGQNIKVVLTNETDRRALIFKEHNPKRYDPRTPDKNSLAFIGIAENATIDTVEKMNKYKSETREIRKKLTAEIIRAGDEAAGKHVVVKNKIEAADKPKLLEADIDISDEDYDVPESLSDDLEQSDKLPSYDDLIDSFN